MIRIKEILLAEHIVLGLDAKTREEFWHGFFDLGVLTLRSGENSIRFRPTLDIAAEAIDEAVELMRKDCRRRK